MKGGGECKPPSMSWNVQNTHCGHYPSPLETAHPLPVGGLTSACILEIFTITGCLIEVPAAVFSGCPRRSARPGDSWWVTTVRAPRKGRGRAHLGQGSGRRGPQPGASPLHRLSPAGHLGGGAPERGPLQAGRSGQASAAPSPAGTLLAGPLSLLLPILPPDGLENQSLAKFSPCPETRHNQAPPGPSGHTPWRDPPRDGNYRQLPGCPKPLGRRLGSSQV